MPTSVAHQTFWDRIPNATSKIALLGKSEHLNCHSASKRQPSSPQAAPRRASKRKQLHPMRSPLAPLPAVSSPQPATPPAKSRRLSVDSSPNTPRPTANTKDDTGMSRAFRLSFSDAYTRNPHEYVQALIDSESTAGMTPGTPLQGKIHMHRSRRSNNSSGYSSSTRHRSTNSRNQQGGSSSTHKQRASNVAKSGRFHHLQVEQTMSENDDANSVATTASDSNDVAEVPASPLRHRYRLPAQPLAASDSEAGGSTPAQLPATECSTPAQNAMDVDSVELENDVEAKKEETPSSLVPPAAPDTSNVAEQDGDAETASNDDGSQPGTPLAESPLSDENAFQPDEQAALTPPADEALMLSSSSSNEDNMPSYRRMGQDFTNQDDVYLITPLFARSNVKWNKADPIDVSNKPKADKLAPAEAHCCSVLRISPEQYLTIKFSLLKEGRSCLPGSFKKRDAQRLCRIDVNKTSKIYEWFVILGWLPESNGIYSNPAPSLP
ncbi:hypothetical protein GGH94_004997 [Coemansia aciculifera]|uniref:SWIRM domain-containing protein n=1 Tax=Coemansia aciculifera TaxID=417176 RepID=A0A9W8M3J3_9FUNG|nr:hypothetical protein GGH94_004997 [Coemansia aciculifera]